MAHLARQILAFTLSVFLLIVTLAGCDSNITEPLDDNPYAQIGALHNEALDAVLTHLQSLDEMPMRAGDLFSFVEASTRSFFREKGITAIDPGMRMGMQIALGGSSPSRGSFANQKTGSGL